MLKDLIPWKISMQLSVYCITVSVSSAWSTASMMSSNLHYWEWSLARMGYVAICCLLSYPLAVCSWPQKNSTSLISGSSKQVTFTSGKSGASKCFWSPEVTSWLVVVKLHGSVFCYEVFPWIHVKGCLAENDSMLEFIDDVDSCYKDLVFDLRLSLGDVVIYFSWKMSSLQ